MLECWFVGNGSDDESVKYPIPKIASIELVAEFIEIFLKKLILYTCAVKTAEVRKRGTPLTPLTPLTPEIAG